MTPEERARDIGWCTCPRDTGADTIGGTHAPHCLVTQIALAIKQAVADEREDWRTMITGAIETCRQRNFQQATAVLVAILESEKEALMRTRA